MQGWILITKIVPETCERICQVLSYLKASNSKLAEGKLMTSFLILKFIELKFKILDNRYVI